MGETRAPSLAALPAAAGRGGARRWRKSMGSRKRVQRLLVVIERRAAIGGCGDWRRRRQASGRPANTSRQCQAARRRRAFRASRHLASPPYALRYAGAGSERGNLLLMTPRLGLLQIFLLRNEPKLRLLIFTIGGGLPVRCMFARMAPVRGRLRGRRDGVKDRRVHGWAGAELPVAVGGEPGSC